MNLSQNNKNHWKQASPWGAGLVVFCIMAISLESFAAPPPTGTPKKNDCKDKWTLTDITPGMKFGDFAIESGTGTITLNGGTARTSGGTVNLVSAGSVVSSHQISITNTLSTLCAWYGISLLWVTDPTTTPMQLAGGSDITMSNVMVGIPGEPGTPFTLPYAFAPTLFPMVVEITATMTANSPQAGGAYSSATYVLGVQQSNATNSGPSAGVADTFSIIPLTLTAGVSMDFGQIAAGSTGGTIILNEASGARSVGSGDADIVSDAVVGIPGTFTMQGAAGLTFNVSYTNGSLTDPAGGNAMTLSTFTDTTAAITLTGGADPFSVGATLTLSGSQPAGTYSTANPGGIPYSITVNYN